MNTMNKKQVVDDICRSWFRQAIEEGKHDNVLTFVMQKLITKIQIE
jgi:hypothetical protein